ncbi:aminopeptidase [Acetobacter sp. AN02]|uniref:aminopeptidase n=1 Tax=Acetobacter sp. AN02 TaxID=2894186 RepID=UPI0024346152|nr:aminopeptidase [Acetobacter sp. AN02]MDG6095668.1 aminopeptidase [Acetobacter sp. AN02]
MSSSPPSSALTIAERIDRLAEVAVRTGLNLKEGQQLIITAPLDAVPLVRRITEHAYRTGASLVTTLYNDDESTLARYRFAPDSAFDTAATWLSHGMAAGFREGAARMAITGGNPSLLSGQNPERISRAGKASSAAGRQAMEIITNFEVNWNIVAAATPAWAAQVFPDLPEDQAVERLWQAIFATSRILNDDPVSEWVEHNARLHRRADKLNGLNFAALHFSGPDTELTVGLADGHRWVGGSNEARNGIVCNPNIPTEEVFTTPHRLRVDGHVRSTKPLSWQGTMLDDIRVVFRDGQITEARAGKGEDVLQRMIGTDEGAPRLGEVALVPHSSPISQSGVLFHNTLFDENAASHIALGQAYAECMFDAVGIGEQALNERGANSSMIHVDWMIGSAETSVYGVNADNERIPLMIDGEWTDAA